MVDNHSPLLIGRSAAKEVLAEAYTSPTASLVSIVGRRRIGKTYLVKQIYGEHICFSVTGIANATKAEQLANFRYQLERTFDLETDEVTHQDWLAAMAHLARLLDRKLKGAQGRQVIFFDELPWLASRRSGFLKAFSWFWNSWAVDQNVVVVISGSAASWMIKKVVRDRGGLHNRITHRIRLEPFTLAEVCEFMDARGLVTDVYQRVQLYMALGGVPFYLNQLRAGESALIAIDRLLFSAHAPLAEEFEQLYASLFENSDHHINVVRTLSQTQQGLTRNQLATASGITSSGTLTRVLEELELSGFILRTVPFGKKRKDALYRLIDEYSRFYLQFIYGHRQGTIDFTQLALKPVFRSWWGYAFENVALRNVPTLCRALGIGGIQVMASSYVARTNDEAGGVQIDLLLDRPDRTITLVEVKFTEDVFSLTKAYAQALRDKKSRFRVHTGTKEQVSLILLTTFGVSGKHLGPAVGIVDTVVKVEELM